jgi:membrane protease YdiL (CAAX protease family)
MAVGVAGALAPAVTERRAYGIGTVAAALCGIGAFAIVRLARPIPPVPVATATTVVIAAIAEELFFRRFLYGALLGWGAAAAVTGSAVAFALVHIPAYGAAVFPLDLAAGFVLSWQRWASGSWTASAAAHAAANLMVIW